MKKRDPQFNLIPYQFKFIGLALVALTALFIIAVKTALIQISPELQETVKTYGLNLFILGLLFIALAKEKVEDERSFQLKTKAFAGGFVGAIIYVLIWPLCSDVFNFTLAELSAQGLALVMLFTHLLTYYLQKFTGEAA